MKAFCLIRRDPVYRRDAFIAGLKAVGYEVHADEHGIGPAMKVSSDGDALVIWNRYGAYHDLASRFELSGGKVLVVENAYLGVDRNNRMRYAIARDGHNGSGCWPVGGRERWDALGIQLKPWREGGEHVLVCPNRSFGMPGGIMPPNWPETIAGRLARFTKRPIRIRPHPGNGKPSRPLKDDLSGAWVVVIWSSSAGCEALVEGIPVICESPWWIAKQATGGIETVESPKMDDSRERAMERLAWAQWHLDEIRSGVAFQHLLHRPSSFA